MLGNFYGTYMENIWTKAPSNYSGSFWSYNFSICLWENTQTLISMISGLLDVSLSPKTNYVYLRRPQDTSNNLINNLNLFDNHNFVNLRLPESMFCQFGKDESPENIDDLSNESLKILDVRSISTKYIEIQIW